MRLSPAFALSGWRWPIAALLMSLVVTAIACSSDNNDASQPEPASQEPTADASPDAATATPETDAAAGFREFAGQLSADVETEGVAALTSRMHGEPVVCAADDVGAGPGGPLCEFEGQQFSGYTVSYWQSEGAIVPIEDATTTLDEFFAGMLPEEQDVFGDGALHVYAINIEETAEPSFDIILSAIVERPDTFAGEGPLRFAVGTSWEDIDGEWGMVSTLHAAIGAEDFLLPSADLVEFVYPNWEAYE